MKCSASVIWMWWSCNEYFLHICVFCSNKNGTEINKVYLYNKCSSGGLGITKYGQI